ADDGARAELRSGFREGVEVADVDRAREGRVNVGDDERDRLAGDASAGDGGWWASAGWEPFDGGAERDPAVGAGSRGVIALLERARPVAREVGAQVPRHRRRQLDHAEDVRARSRDEAIDRGEVGVPGLDVGDQEA